MIPNPAIRNSSARPRCTRSIPQLQIGQTKYGMQTMTQSLTISICGAPSVYDEAMGHATEAR
jgi:hypothetical protein